MGTQNQNYSPIQYNKGLHEVADGIFAYLQPDGGWGWSNAGLAVGDGSSLLVDTLFDLALTQEMLDEMAAIVDTSPIGTLVNTHANGDHCYGNQLVTGAEVITSAASAAEMEALPPAALAAMLDMDFGSTTNEYLREAFGPFTFTGIEPPRIDRTFSGSLALAPGGKAVELIEVGPAHTAGDLLVYLPEDKVIFTGDILFINGTPLVWDGPIRNWISACDRILELDCSVIVPGHGPLTDATGVKAVREYLQFVVTEASLRHGAGMSAADAARDIELGAYTEWSDWERIAINVDSVYTELDAQHESPGIIGLFSQMASLKLG